MWEGQDENIKECLGGLHSAKILLYSVDFAEMVAPQIQEQINIPILHIADATAGVLKANGVKKVALLGTKYTMLQDFYKKRIQDNARAAARKAVPLTPDL